MKIVETLYKAIKNVAKHTCDFKSEEYTIYLGHEEFQQLRHDMHYQHMATISSQSKFGDGEFNGIKIFHVSTRNHLNIVKDTVKTEEQIVYKLLS